MDVCPSDMTTVFFWREMSDVVGGNGGEGIEERELGSRHDEYL
jgi:hypothetical protein